MRTEALPTRGHACVLDAAAAIFDPGSRLTSRRSEKGRAVPACRARRLPQPPHPLADLCSRPTAPAPTLPASM